MNSQDSILSTLDWAQDPMLSCAGQPVITSANFLSLAESLQEFDEINAPVETIVSLFFEESKKYAVCGAGPGVNGRFAVLRKNPSIGWQYLITLIEEVKLEVEEEQVIPDRFVMDNYPHDTKEQVLGVFPNVTMYVKDLVSIPQINDVLFTDVYTENLFQGGSKFYGFDEYTWLQINDQGVIIDKGQIAANYSFVMEVDIPSDNFEFVLTNSIGSNHPLEFGNNAVADWGDGTTDTLNDSNYAPGLSFTKTYATAGSYQVTFTGRLNQVGFNQSPTNDTVKRITQWGDLGNIFYDFYQCHYIESIPDGAITGLLNSKRGTKFNGEKDYTYDKTRYLFNWRDAYSLEALPTGFTEFIKYEDTGLSIFYSLNGVRSIEAIPDDWLDGVRAVSVNSFLDEAWRVKYISPNLLNNAHSITGKWGTYSLNALGRDYRTYDDITLEIDDQFFSKVEFEPGRGDLFSQWNIAEIPRDILQNSLSSPQNGGTGKIDIERFCCEAIKITDIPDGIFEGFQIQSRGLQAFRGTKITKLKTSWFGGTKQTNEIDLGDLARDTLVSEVDIDFFNGYFPNVTSLATALYNTPITEIQDTLFRDLPKLKRVDFLLNRTSIQTVPVDFLKESVLMENISYLFSTTPITEVPANIFKDFSKVTKAEGVFSNSDIITIPEDLFYDMPLVDSFYRLFYRCKQIEYAGEIFKNSVNVTKMNSAFQEATINTVPSTLLENCTELVDITMLFRGANRLVNGIDEDFLINNTKINSLFYSFENSKCTVLPSINHLSELTTMERAFWRYGGLSIPKDYLDGMNSLENVKYAWSDIPTIEGVIPRFWRDLTLNLTNTEGAFSGTNNAINWPEVPLDWGGEFGVDLIGFYIDQTRNDSNYIPNPNPISWLAHDGEQDEPLIGDVIFTNYFDSVTFDGDNGFFAISNGECIQIDPNGVVIDKVVYVTPFYYLDNGITLAAIDQASGGDTGMFDGKMRIVASNEYGFGDPYSLFSLLVGGEYTFDQIVTTKVIDGFFSAFGPIPSFYPFGFEITGLENWDVRQVKNSPLGMMSMFSNANLNSDLSAWDVKGVQTIFNAFFNVNFITDPKIGSWDVSETPNIAGAFYNSNYRFTDIANWRPLAATDMSVMFLLATEFNADLRGWELPSMLNSGGYHSGAYAWNPEYFTLTLDDYEEPVNPPGVGFYLDENGVTVKAFADTPVGHTDVFNGTTITLADRDMIYNNGEGPSGDASQYCTTGIKDFSSIFYNNDGFVDDISAWDTSAAVTFEAMFQGASSFNGDLSYWDTSNCTDFYAMFNQATAFNTDIKNWDVSNAVQMSYMFQFAASFNQNLSCWAIDPSIPMVNYDNGADSWYGYWKVQSTCIIDRFYYDENGVTIKAYENTPVGTTAILDGVYYTLVDRAGLDTAIANKQDLSKLVITGIDSLENLFPNNNEYSEAIDLSSWDTSSVTNLKFTFFFFTFLGDPGLEYWDVSNVTHFTSCFAMGNYNWDITNWDVGQGSDFSSMFQGNSVFNQPIGDWNMSNATLTFMMFWQASTFDQYLNDWNVSKVENMASMFNDCPFSGDLNNWDTSNVWNFAKCFGGLFAPVHGNVGDISNWNFTGANGNLGMFDNGSQFNQSIDGWNLTGLTSLRGLLSGCSNFDQPINISVEGVTDLAYFFFNCSSFNHPLDDWDVSSNQDYLNMFRGATVFNQDLSCWPSDPNASYITYDQDTPAWIEAYKILSPCSKEVFDYNLDFNL